MPDKKEEFLAPDEPVKAPAKSTAPTKRADGTDTSVPSIAEQEAQKQEFNQRTLAGATSISAAPSGSFGHPIVWMQELQNDLKHGSGITSVGRVLQHILPQNGAYGGKSEAAADFAAGPFLGPPKAMEGVLTTGHGIGTGDVKETIRGVNKTVAGTGQTLAPILGATNPAFIPAMVGSTALAKTGSSLSQTLGGDADTNEFMGNVAAIAVPSVMGRGKTKIPAPKDTPIDVRQQNVLNAFQPKPVPGVRYTPALPSTLPVPVPAAAIPAPPVTINPLIRGTLQLHPATQEQKKEEFLSPDPE